LCCLAADIEKVLLTGKPAYGMPRSMLSQALIGATGATLHAAAVAHWGSSRDVIMLFLFQSPSTLRLPPTLNSPYAAMFNL
jgi:hypothetical protein